METIREGRELAHSAYDFLDRQSIEMQALYLIEQRGNSLNKKIQFKEYEDNARTALMEALTAAGHLSSVEISGTLEEINSQIISRLLNGWNDSLPDHEKDRRFSELCNELVIQALHQRISAGILSHHTEVLEISDYPEALLGYEIGYRDANKKGFVRSTSLIHCGGNQYKRRIESISRSNATWHSTFRFLDEHNIKTTEKPSDIAALEIPVVYSRHSYMNGVVDIMSKLDTYSGLDVMYGDKGSKINKHPHYQGIRQESSRREQALEQYFKVLAKLEEQLDNKLSKGLITKETHTSILHGQIETILDAICTEEPSYAEDTFGAQAVPIFVKANYYNFNGRNESARNLIMNNSHLKGNVVFCGVTISLDRAKKMGLDTMGYSELLLLNKNKWKWQKGVCVNKICPTRPGKTNVGPCGICKLCQAKFDQGRDPTKGSIIDLIARDTRSKKEERRKQTVSLRLPRQALEAA